jgi:hypothetical protein
MAVAELGKVIPKSRKCWTSEEEEANSSAA